MKTLTNSIFAGIMIGIACLVNLHVDINWVGALLFSVGLIVITLRGFKLFTGVVGYADTYKQIPFLLICLLGNIIGLFMVSLSTDTTVGIMIANKLQTPLHMVFLKGVWCGFLMFMSVDIYRTKHSLVGILFCVPAFILAGFEHSIADAFYIMLNGELTFAIVQFLVIVIFGNALGAQIGRISKK